MARTMLLWLLIGAVLTVSSHPALADEQSLGQEAEQAGDLATALTHYVAALQADVYNDELRQRIITLVQQMPQPPDVSIDAKRHMARGEAAIEEAQGAADFAAAAEEFAQAVWNAPWWGNAYFNLGVAYEQASNYENAVWSLNYYLQAVPNAPDAEAVQTKIFKLEYKAEKQLAPQPVETVEATPVAPAPPDLAGKWARYRAWDGVLQTDYPCYATMTGNFFEFRLTHGVMGFPEFEGEIDGNTIQGVAIIDWSDWPSDGGKIHRQPMTGEVSTDGNTLTLRYDTIDRLWEEPFITKFRGWETKPEEWVLLRQ